VPADVGWQKLKCPGSAFSLGSYREALFLTIKAHMQDVRLAANLAVFDVSLHISGRLVDLSDVPLSAISTLKPRGHTEIVT
jgi:hypothetical protein